MTTATNGNGVLEAADSQQFLTFKLAGEEYGVGILTVQEIRGWSRSPRCRIRRNGC